MYVISNIYPLLRWGPEILEPFLHQKIDLKHGINWTNPIPESIRYIAIPVGYKANLTGKISFVLLQLLKNITCNNFTRYIVFIVFMFIIQMQNNYMSLIQIKLIAYCKGPPRSASLDKFVDGSSWVSDWTTWQILFLFFLNYFKMSLVLPKQV